ncbi:MAG: helix-turn-helix domain-containing protein [Thermoplasmata archaeon]|nr:helix-turn-helix domain-containing protein [Thermoplasmata archaeon]
MPVIDTRIRVRHPCPYCDVSVAYPRSLLLLWCENRRDVFLVSSPDVSELRRVLSGMREAFRARSLVEDGPSALVVVPDFQWPDPPAVTRMAEKAGLWTLPPIVYFEGKETYRFVAPNQKALNRLLTPLRRVGEVELLSVTRRTGLGSIRNLPTASVHFFEGLTDLQAQALVAAFEEGLLHVPSRSTWDAVARRQGLSRSTFGEHLRKGQLRILANSYSALKSRTLEATEPVVLPPLKRAERPGKAPLRGTRPVAS